MSADKIFVGLCNTSVIEINNIGCVISYQAFVINNKNKEKWRL